MVQLVKYKVGLHLEILSILTPMAIPTTISMRPGTFAAQQWWCGRRGGMEEAEGL
jgi:hypothetical protein